MTLLPEELYIGKDRYEPVSDESRIAVSYLLRIKERLGIPDDAVLEGTAENLDQVNKVVLRYALEIYRVWAALYPLEHKAFIDATEFELTHERPVKEAVKAGGYSPTSFPMRLERMWSILLPNIKTQDKRFWKPLFSSIPELKRSNYA